MAISTATISIPNVRDYVGTGFDLRRIRLYATTNIPGGSIFDTSNGALYQGGGKGVINADGSASIVVPVPGSSNPSSWQTTIHLDYPDPGNRGQHQVRDFGPFTITATATLGSLVVQQEIPPVYLTTVTAALDAKVTSATTAATSASASATSAAASAALAQSISGISTSDSAIATSVNLPTSSSRAAMAALFDRTAGVSLDNFSAVAGDGTTNDTAAIASATTALAAFGRGTLKFNPNKTYLVDNIIMREGVTFEGFGAVIKGRVSTTEGVFQAVGWGGSTTIYDTVVRGFRIDANGIAKRGVFVYLAERVVVENNTIYGGGTNFDTGVRLHQNTKECTVRGNHITLPTDSPFGTVPASAGIYCVSATPDSQGGGQNNTLTFGSASSLSQQHLIDGNWVFNGTHGISLFGAADCRVVNNYLYGQSHRSVIMSPLATRNVIANNTMREYGSTAVHMAWGCTFNTISDNNCYTTVSANEGNGIKGYYGCSDNTVVGNTVRGTIAGGIRFAMGSARNLIADNRIDGCAIGVQIQSYLPSSGGYYQPTTPPAADATVIRGNLITNSPKGIELDASGGANVSNTTLSNNDLYDGTTSGVSLVEAGTQVTSVTAHGTKIVGATTAWVTPRGERHFGHKSHNTSLTPSPAGSYLRTGSYYQCTGSATVSTTNALGVGTLRVTPFKVPNTLTVTRIGLEVTVVGDTGSVLRLVIYASDAQGLPSALVLDAGTVPGDAVAVAELTVSQSLSPGTYWVGAVPQNVTTTQPTVRALIAASGAESDGPALLTTGATPVANQTYQFAYSMSGVTGAAPGTFTVAGATPTAARIFVKV